MTDGFGAMYSYAARLDPADRWRIAAYIRVLQLSRNAHLSDVPEARAAEAAAATAGARDTQAAIGATETAMNSSDTVRPQLDRLQRNALVCGVIGVIVVSRLWHCATRSSFSVPTCSLLFIGFRFRSVAWRF